MAGEGNSARACMCETSDQLNETELVLFWPGFSEFTSMTVSYRVMLDVEGRWFWVAVSD